MKKQMLRGKEFIHSNEYGNNISSIYRRKLTMKRVAKFEKVSPENFKKSMSEHFNSITDVTIDTDVFDINYMYDLLKVPKRATKFNPGSILCANWF